MDLDLDLDLRSMFRKAVSKWPKMCVWTRGGRPLKVSARLGVLDGMEHAGWACGGRGKERRG